MPNKRNIKFNGWAAEQRHADLLRSIYGKNPAQLRQLWQDLPADIQADSDVRSTFALCFLRLADLESAKSVDPDVFYVDETKLFGAVATHRLARLLIWLYLKNLSVIYVPIAAVLNLWLNRFSDAQLLLGMYFKVWSNNTLGLKYILPLFIRMLLRPASPDRHRNICFFGYICALNCILDQGIEVMEREIAHLQKLSDQHPRDLWLQEMDLLLAMLCFYNLDYGKAEALHQRIGAESIGDKAFLFVRTMSYGSWLRLAAVNDDQTGFESISKTLQGILQSDYDKRFALRTHSYRSLIAARRHDKERCLQELALANSISDKNPWGLEYCNHFGVTTKVYLYNHMPERALDAARGYLAALAKGSFQSSFVWEANILALKVIIINRLLVPQLRQDQSLLKGFERSIHASLRPYLALSRRWRRLYLALSQLAADAQTRDPAFIRAEVAKLHAEHPGQFDEMMFALRLGNETVAEGTTPAFERAANQATQALRFNRELLTYSQVLKQADLGDLDALQIVDHSKPIFSLLLPGSQIAVSELGDTATNGQELADGISEICGPDGFTLTIAITTDRSQSPSTITLTGYSESLNFRRDILAPLTLWKEATENAVREERLRLSELEREKSTAITKTTQILAHDVRKPFSLMEGMLSMLLQGADKQLVHRFHNEVRVAIASVNGMLSDIMEIGAAKRQVIGESGSLHKALGSALIQNVALMRRADVTFRYELSHRRQLGLDEAKLVRILANIVANALPAMKYQGVITFSSIERQDVAAVSIHNTGSYIEPKHQARVFEPFFTHGKKDGTGLGLAIVGKIISDAGGQIACTSTEAGGTTFTVELPMAATADLHAEFSLPLHSRDVLQPTVAATPTDLIASEEARTGDQIVKDLKNAIKEHVAANGRPLRILVCDDEDLYIVALKSHLNDLLGDGQGITFDQCRTAEDAIRKVSMTRYDLVILDVDLKGSQMNGFELSRDVRALSPLAVICIHSNRGEIEFHTETQRSGANLFLPKPIHRIHLLQILLTTVEKTKKERAATC